MKPTLPADEHFSQRRSPLLPLKHWWHNHRNAAGRAHKYHIR